MELARERYADARAEVEKRRLARLARTLVEAAVVLEREGARRAVREKLEAPKHPLKAGE